MPEYLELDQVTYDKRREEADDRDRAMFGAEEGEMPDLRSQEEEYYR